MSQQTFNNGDTGTVCKGVIDDNFTELYKRLIVQNSQSGNYTAVLTDAGKHIYHPASSGSGHTYTIPSNASVAYTIGTELTFVNDEGTHDITIDVATDTLIWAETGQPGSRLLATQGIARALKVTSTRWILDGAGIS